VLAGCGDEGKNHRVATPTPAVTPTPCLPDPTGCNAGGNCRTHADCGAADGICEPSALDDGRCFCRFVGPCRYREVLGGCAGSCGAPGLSFCISAHDLDPVFGDPRGCACEPPSPTPDPMSTPIPAGCIEAQTVASADGGSWVGAVARERARYPRRARFAGRVPEATDALDRIGAFSARLAG
jgi:hypothetical protein